MDVLTVEYWNEMGASQFRERLWRDGPLPKSRSQSWAIHYANLAEARILSFKNEVFECPLERLWDKKPSDFWVMHRAWERNFEVWLPLCQNWEKDLEDEGSLRTGDSPHEIA